MAKCLNCGEELTGDFCINCGSPAPKSKVNLDKSAVVNDITETEEVYAEAVEDTAEEVTEEVVADVPAPEPAPNVNTNINTNINPNRTAVQPYNPNPYNQNYNQNRFQGNYQTPPPLYNNNINVNMQNNTTSVGGWVGWLVLIAFTNIIGIIIMLCVSKDPSVKNFAKAELIIFGIVFVLTIIFMILCFIFPVLLISMDY
ncbi:MAG: hypothetical protein NC340_01055 [Ruminococcus flavefaciens]|nr:hypothetical protein [Ruminococcus flavefaciens]MCM1228734.1 hypothetical protein [Ruminococcus flavefaciens]